MLGWDTMQATQQAFRRCWDQFLAQASLPRLLESDTAVVDEPITSCRIPVPYQRPADKTPDEIDLLVDEQIFNGMRGQW